MTLHGTGINPGGITERFPLMLSALCRDIRHVRAEEFSDIRNYPTEMVVRDIMLFGKAPDVAAKSPMIDVLGHGFMQSIDMVAAELGFALDPEKRTLHEMAVATKPLDTPVGVIEAGTVAAQRFTWEGTVDGEPVDDRARELADGRDRSRSAVDARRAALRGRARRRAAGVGARSTACTRPSSASTRRSG